MQELEGVIRILAPTRLLYIIHKVSPSTLEEPVNELHMLRARYYAVRAPKEESKNGF